MTEKKTGDKAERNHLKISLLELLVLRDRVAERLSVARVKTFWGGSGLRRIGVTGAEGWVMENGPLCENQSQMKSQSI